MASKTCNSCRNIKQCENDNFSSKLIKVKKLFNVWSQRDLSLYVKITVAKTLGSQC